MRTVRVIYRREPDGAWIGTSPEIPGYTAYGDTYDEARARAQDGLGWFAEQDLAIAHIVPEKGPDVVEGRATRGPRVSFGMTKAPKVPSYGHSF
ncbi:MAG: hypothetical protein QOD71_1737 [Thermoleophilaceae bacterium]|jgi:predicted RNase H-like HicB family nuclease|nr:hypothetical protein [Thermoleophilaceae bacterium]